MRSLFSSYLEKMQTLGNSVGPGNKNLGFQISDLKGIPVCLTFKMKLDEFTLAEIDEYTTYYPSQELDWRQQLLESFSSALKSFIPEIIRRNIILKDSINSLKEIDTFNDPKGMYVRCENCVI